MTNHPSLVPITRAGLCRPHELWYQRLYMDQIPTFGSFPAHYSQFCSTAKILLTVLHSQFYPVCVHLFPNCPSFYSLHSSDICSAVPRQPNTHTLTNPVGAGSLYREVVGHTLGVSLQYVRVCCFQVCLHSHTQCTLAFSALSTLMRMGMCTIKAM